MRISYFSIDFLAGPTTHTPSAVTHTPSTTQHRHQQNPVPQSHTPLQLRWHISKFSAHLSPAGDGLSFVMCGWTGGWWVGGGGVRGRLPTACDPIGMWFEIDPDFMSAATRDNGSRVSDHDESFSWLLEKCCPVTAAGMLNSSLGSSEVQHGQVRASALDTDDVLPLSGSLNSFP